MRCSGNLVRSLLVVLLISCGGKPPPTAQTSSARAVLPDVPFDKLDVDQKKQFMGEKVMPAMKPIFQHHDPHDFAKFQCETCHGKGAPHDRFDMPHPDLPKLDFANMSKWKSEDLEWM